MNADIVKKALQGDESAFEYIYKQTSDDAYAVAYSVLHDTHDALDVVQDSYLSMFEHLGSLENPSKLESWFKRIVKNNALNFQKSGYNRNITSFTDMESWDEDESFDYEETLVSNYAEFSPEETVDYAETQRLIWGIVDQLPENQKECVLLRWKENKKIREIAQITNVKEATVKSRLNYAYFKIEEAVKQLEKEGTKLYGITPIAIIPFLRWMLGGTPISAATAQSAAAAATSAATAAASAASTGGAAAGTVSGATATTEAGSAAGTTAATSAAAKGVTALLGQISAKAVAGIVAGLIAVGGIGYGLGTITDTDVPTEPVVQATEAISEPTEPATTAPPETSAPTEETLPPVEYLDQEYLSQLPYTGDISQCKMTVQQANAYAQVIEDSYNSISAINSFNSFCRTALFDPGNGVPILWVVTGEYVTDLGYADQGMEVRSSRFYQWNGTNVVLANVPEGLDIALTDDGILTHFYATDIFGGHRILYGLSDGKITKEPIHMSEIHYIFQDSMPNESELQVALAYFEDLFSRDFYNYDTLSPDKWISPDGSYSPWEIGSIDGQFISRDQPSQLDSINDPSIDEWILGHGQAGGLYLTQTWIGNWGDGWETANVLRGGNEEDDSWETGVVPVQVATNGWRYKTDTVYNPKSQIERTTVDPEGYNLEISYEIPAFSEKTPGYEKINNFFADLRAEFFSGETTGAVAVWNNVTAPGSRVDEEGPYVCHDTAKIITQTDELVSISMEEGYWAGSSPYSYVEYYTFRTDTGELLELTDLLSGTESEILARILKKLEEEYFYSFDPYAKEYTLDDFGFYVAYGRVCVTYQESDSWFYDSSDMLTACLMEDIELRFRAS